MELVKQKRERIAWIDLAKAIGIIFVLVGHVIYPASDKIYSVIKEFHMPLFFFLSGLTFRELDRPTSYITHKIKTLWVPYVICNVLFALFHNTLVNAMLLSGERYSITELLKILTRVLTFDTNESLGGATWFLAALFEASVCLAVIFYITRRVQKHRTIYIVTLSCLLLAIGLCLQLPRHIGSAMVGMSFMLLGYYAKKICIDIKASIRTSILAVLALVILLILAPYNDVQMVHNMYSNILFFYIGALCGIYLVVFVAKLSVGLSKSKILNYIGQNTLYILCLHFCFYLAVNYLQMIVRGLDFVHVSDFPTITNGSILWAVVYIVTAAVGSISIAMILKKTNRVVHKVLTHPQKPDPLQR